MNKLIHLKTVKSTNPETGLLEKAHYVMIATTLKEALTIKNSKELSLTAKEILLKHNYNILNIKELLFAGTFDQATNVSNFVTKFKQRKIDIHLRKEEYYRNYMRTVEQQIELNAYVNTAPDAYQSWITALKSIGSPYGVIIKVPIEN